MVDALRREYDDGHKGTLFHRFIPRAHTRALTPMPSQATTSSAEATPNVAALRARLTGETPALPPAPFPAVSPDAAEADLARIAGAVQHMSARPSGAVQRSSRNIPFWMVPLAVLATLVALTLALWRAESSLESTRLETQYHRGSTWVLWGGVAGSVLTAAFVYLTLLQRGHDHEQTRRHLEALESLQAISSTIIAHIDAGPSTLVALCESARTLLRMGRCGIQIVDAKADRLELLAHAGDMPPNPPRFYDLAELPTIRQCLDSGQLFLVDDVTRLDQPHNEAMFQLFGVRAMVLIPLTLQGEQIGLMTLSGSSPHTFADIDRRLAELLGSQAAVILANSRLHQAQQVAVQKYKALVDQRELLFSTNAAIYQTGDLEESLRRVAELAPMALAVDFCVVALGAPAPDNVRIAAFTPGAQPQGMRVGSTFFCPASERAFQRGVICVFANASEDPDVDRFRSAFPEMGSMACVPLIGRDGSRFGVLTLVRRRPGPFSSEQLKMARLFSTRAAAAIENARLHQETRKSLEEQKKLLAQRDTLWAVNAAVYRAGTLEESLDRVARLAPAALGVDLCAVDLTTGRPDELYLAAITHDLGREMIGLPFSTTSRNAGRAMASREPLVMEDARLDPGIPDEFKRRFRIGSIVYLPLFRSDGEPLGLLVLVRHAPGPFDKARIETARVFATRAASAIENAQLLEQTRKDADTKAMLLRELNHRVKNNLAGIVALLSMGRPPMPQAAGHWLDRVTDRVRVMAGAHQLFVGDSGSVRIAALVERMLSSLSVARAPGVEMRVEHGIPKDAGLPAEQAISLAMALHELCYNAIVHGLGGRGGTVILRTRESAPGRFAVDVIDDGAGPSAAPAVDSSGSNGNVDGDFNGEGDGDHSGIGLEIVKGLVTRELRGKFSLDSARDGTVGTVATVDFPLQLKHQPPHQPNSSPGATPMGRAPRGDAQQGAATSADPDRTDL
jgi:GAF domain-containing protein/anti-sigma regulatory factor (Ser/Thr protein kinase)